MAPKLFLYDVAASSYAQMVRITLREKGIEFTSKYPDDMMAASPTGNFAKANPRAEVPTLVDGDVTLFETSIILQYIDEKWPTPPLLPKDPALKARARLTAEVCLSQFEGANWVIGETRMFKRAEGELLEKIENNVWRVTQDLHEWLSERLGSSSYFSGSDFGYADICVAPVLNRNVKYGMGPPEGSTLLRWLARVGDRSSVQETFEEFERGMKDMAGMGNIFNEQGDKFKREYRDHRLDCMIRAGGIDVVLEGLEKKNIRFSWPYVTE